MTRDAMRKSFHRLASHSPVSTTHFGEIPPTQTRNPDESPVPTSSEFNSRHKRRNCYNFAGHVIPVCLQAPGADIREEDEGQRAAMSSGRREGTTPPRLVYVLAQKSISNSVNSIQWN